MTPKETILATAAELGLAMQADFVPWSQSRHKAEDRRTLNWKITIRKGDRDVLSTDYSAGVAHCPAYQSAKSHRDSIYNSEAIEFETETGCTAKRPLSDINHFSKGKPILPDFDSVLASLALDSDVLDHGTFESWAGDFGYDLDSRKAESVYRACLQIALQLRAGIGDDGLTKLREACRDY